MSFINFVSEDSIEEARRARQEEWDKAYENKENPPPLQEEIPYDPRTLYERLQEQRQKKDDAFAEATKFGNLIHKIDNDEFDFLNTLEHDEAKKKRELAEQEEEELKKFRMNVQIKSAPQPQQPASLASMISESNPFSLTGVSGLSSAAASSATSTSTASSAQGRKKKTSLFAGLVKRDDSASSPSSSTSKIPPTSKDMSPTAQPVDKRKVDSPSSSSESAKSLEPENKKVKVDESAAATKPKPNALLSLAAYDSDSDEDE